MHTVAVTDASAGCVGVGRAAVLQLHRGRWHLWAPLMLCCWPAPRTAACKVASCVVLAGRHLVPSTGLLTGSVRVQCHVAGAMCNVGTHYNLSGILFATSLPGALSSQHTAKLMVLSLLDLHSCLPTQHAIWQLSLTPLLPVAVNPSYPAPNRHSTCTAVRS